MPEPTDTPQPGDPINKNRVRGEVPTVVSVIEQFKGKGWRVLASTGQTAIVVRAPNPADGWIQGPA